MAYLLGIDVGTTGARAVLIDEEGTIVGAGTSEYPLLTPQPKWAEQDPEDWWSATGEAIQTAFAAAGISGDEVRGVGLSGQMHGLVLLDAQGQVLRPAILWCDQRTTAECAWITETVGARRLIELTCNPALEGFTAPKLLWVRRHEPHLLERTARVLLPKDYVRWRLTGVCATEVSDASGTLLFDVRNRRWSDEMLRLLDVPRAWLPDVYESPVVSGQISETAARATGLRAGTPVVGGGGDQAAGGVGNGVVRPGIVSSTIGTSGVIFAFAEEVRLDPRGRVHTFCHAVPGKWHVMGVTQGAGLSLRWFRDNFGGIEIEAGNLAGIDPYTFLVREAERAPAGSEGLLWLPYLMGERTPHLDANAKGVLFGVTARHTRFHVIRAILEGVAFSLRDSFEILREMDVPIDQVRASGGGSRSELWRQIQADVFGTPMVTINATEGPAFGVALLAGVGTGVWASVEEACDATIRVTSEAQPDLANAALYDRLYQVYRALYPALKPSFDTVTALMAAP
jgi:xylulokinase